MASSVSKDHLVEYTSFSLCRMKSPLSCVRVMFRSADLDFPGLNDLTLCHPSRRMVHHRMSRVQMLRQSWSGISVAAYVFL